MSDNENTGAKVETVKIDVSKLAKLLGIPSINSQEVSIEDSTNQTRKVTMGAVIEKFNANPTEVNKLGFTNEVTLKKCIEALIDLSKPQVLGYALNALVSGGFKNTVKLDGYNLHPDGSDFDAVIKDMYDSVEVGKRGRQASNTQVFEL